MARAPASDKSPDKSERAFRTISEAAEAIGVPQHVLRFWETRFPQLQPLKRGGNRRYYRPADMALLETIRSMLHDRGLTIRGARLALAEAADAPREAPAVQREAPSAQREAPAAQREAPAAQRGAPAAQRGAPEAQSEAHRTMDADHPAATGFVEPDVAAVPIAAPSGTGHRAAGKPALPAIDIAALAAIRDRLRHALAA